MKLIVGLGNPGSKYSHTRHNIGFRIIDSVAKKMHLKFKEGNELAVAKNKSVILLKPLTFMNLSGKTVSQILRKNTIEEILIIVDDIYLDFAKIRIRERGGDGGHNGIKSIVDEIAFEEFFRFRVGIGNDTKNELSDFVLSEFSNEEEKILKETIEFSSYLISIFIDNSYKELLNSFSKMKNSYSKKVAKILESFSPKEDNNE